ncbi:MAG TPA: lysophospholipid acyltransferase family protein [Kiritimatiellia bacterium]|nr:lysophospholipid acyltransferase family protein [Kiritimatiellia bacterium]
MAVRWRYRAEYALLVSISALLNALPLRLALLLAAGCSALVYRLSPGRPRAARKRIAEVFPDKTPGEVDIIARRALRNLFFSVVETLRFPRLDRAWMERHIDVGNFPEQVEAHLKPGQGAMLVIPHMGNWEMAGLYAGMRGIPMFFLVGRQRNPLAERFLNRARSATGIDVLTRDENSARVILRHLKAGKVFGILPDVRMKMPGVAVNFLGHPADLPGGIGLFARRLGVPVFIGHVRRIGWTRHAWQFLPPIWSDPEADPEADAKRITQLAADHFTEAVRRHPDQYFWYNKRWVLEPRG